MGGSASRSDTSLAIGQVKGVKNGDCGLEQKRALTNRPFGSKDSNESCVGQHASIAGIGAHRGQTSLYGLRICETAFRGGIPTKVQRICSNCSNVISPRANRVFRISTGESRLVSTGCGGGLGCMYKRSISRPVPHPMVLSLPLRELFLQFAKCIVDLGIELLIFQFADFVGQRPSHGKVC